MIGFVWRLIVGGLWKPILKGLAMVGLYFKGRADAKAKQAEATVKGIQAGAKGAAKAEADLRAGKTPEDIVRGNDRDWR